jgi:hypothetical protein
MVRRGVMNRKYTLGMAGVSLLSVLCWATLAFPQSITIQLGRCDMAETTKWIVTTSGDRPLQDVARQLSGAGFAIEQVLDEIGCITGFASADVAEQLRTIPGVGDVSPEQSIDIGPPDAPVTW